MSTYRTTERDTELHEIFITESRLTSPTDVTVMGIDPIVESSVLPYLKDGSVWHVPMCVEENRGPYF